MTTIYVVDAFTTKPNTGNRAGVVLDADHLTTQEMQDIAALQGIQKLPLFCHRKIRAMIYMFDILPLHMKSRSVDMPQSQLIFYVQLQAMAGAISEITILITEEFCHDDHLCS
ncbi:PhzF family phenazine biosynthesis protein [Streptococcus agalactiae]|uniref:PhzF family phenazine biosynthesis protein n=1 Tax=Streptococcus agalactiae TaxID=1311 RepID=UPI001C609CD1